MDEKQAKFEAWYKAEMCSSPSFFICDDGFYDESHEQIAWRGYQAALASEAVAKLQHEVDTLQGLWATDKPEHIPPELAPYFFRIGFPQENLPATSKNEHLFLGDSTYPHTPDTKEPV